MQQATIEIESQDVPIAYLTDEELVNYFRFKMAKRARRDTLHVKLAVMRAFQGAGIPQTVRQVYYQCVVMGAVPKTDGGYRVVARQVLALRRCEIVPWHWVADNTRWMRKVRSYSNLDHYLRSVRHGYRRAVWSDDSDYLEVWCEKDALSGVIQEVTDAYDVPLMVSRGFASETYLFEAAEEIKRQNRKGRRAYVYYLGDHDPTGKDIAHQIRKGLDGFSADVDFEEVAVTPSQIIDWQLPSHKTKLKKRPSKRWPGGDSVELDAIPANKLQDLVRTSIERHIDWQRLTEIKAAEQRDMRLLQRVIDEMSEAAF